MSLASVLKTLGHDLKDVGGWIDDGLKIAEPLIGAIDPPLGIIIMEVESVLGALTGSSAALTSAQLQGIIRSVATLEGIKSNIPAPTQMALPGFHVT